MKFIDLFSGIGGFRLGLERCNNGEKKAEQYECVWSCDNNRYANQVYTARFGEENHFAGDIRGVDAAAIPDFALLCAGFPCQSFSVAGKRKGFSDPRGTLFYEILRVASAKRPALLLLENVRGLLSNEEGETFLTVLRELGRIGYWAEWQVLNSKHFMVPQNRERVFIVGHSREGSTTPLFPVSEDCQGYSTAIREEKTVDVFYGAHAPNSPEKRWGKHHIKTSVCPTLATDLAIANTVDQDGYLRFGERPVDENGKKQLVPIGYRRIRRLTPVECERLQGFPDNWTKELSDTQRYKCLGNAVTVPVISFLGKLLLNSVSNHSEETSGSGGSK